MQLTDRIKEIERLSRAGNKIAAIKLFRETFRVGLKEAKDAVENYERTGTLGVSPTASSPEPMPTDPDELRAARIREVGRLLRGGKKIEAIKVYRAVFGVGLKEAKDAIDRLETTVDTPGAFEIHPDAPPGAIVTPRVYPRPAPTVEPTSNSARGCFVALIALALLAAAGLWLTYSANGGDNQVAAFVRRLSPAATPAPTPLPTATPAPSATPAPTPTPEFAAARVLAGGEGNGPGRFEDARSIGVDGEGRIYVSNR